MKKRIRQYIGLNCVMFWNTYNALMYGAGHGGFEMMRSRISEENINE